MNINNNKLLYEFIFSSTPPTKRKTKTKQGNLAETVGQTNFSSEIINRLIETIELEFHNQLSFLNQSAVNEVTRYITPTLYSS